MGRRIVRALIAACALALLLAAICAAGAETAYFRTDNAEAYLWGDKAIAMDAGNRLNLVAVAGEKDLEPLEILDCESSDETVATVNDYGQIRALKAGTVAIALETELGTTYTANVSVIDPGKPDKLYFTQKSIKLYTGEIDEGTLDDVLRVRYGKTDVRAAGVTWKSSNASVVAVDRDGELTAKKPGSAIITATKNKKKASIRVEVKRNRIDRIFPKPKLSKIASNDYAVYLKSLEFTNNRTVVAEYYLLFTYPAKYRTTKFSWIKDKICVDRDDDDDDDDDDPMTIVEGTVKNVKVSTKGRTVKVFKVTYTGSAVRDTDFVLSNERGNITHAWDCYLKWKR